LASSSASSTFERRAAIEAAKKLIFHRQWHVEIFCSIVFAPHLMRAVAFSPTRGGLFARKAKPRVEHGATGDFEVVRYIRRPFALILVR
jgi:hypothetical protein